MITESPYIKDFLQKSNDYQSLQKSERASILMNYFFNDRKYISNSGLKREEKQLLKKLFIELHTSFYTKIIRGPKYIKTSRIILHFLYLRTKENLRLILFSSKPYNLNGFIHGIRSQIEINALLNKFLKEDDKYFEEYFLKSEDRKDENRLLNVLTLIDHMGDQVVSYRKLYEQLSNILHPNPTAVKLHTQATPSSSNIKSLYNPWMSFYFNETYPNSLISQQWFNLHLEPFTMMVIHFLELIKKLDKDFFISHGEEKDFEMISTLQIINQKEFFKYINSRKDNSFSFDEYFDWLEKRRK